MKTRLLGPLGMPLGMKVGPMLLGPGGHLHGECVNCTCPGCHGTSLLGTSLLGGLGDPINFTYEPGDLPDLGPPPDLEDIQSASDVATYAAAGFHVAVLRGTNGGCSNGPSTTCSGPLGSQDIADAWDAAAQAYSVVYGMAVNPPVAALSDLITSLLGANGYAAQAYAAEGATVKPKTFTPPGSTTKVQTIDPFGKPGAMAWVIGGGFALAALGLVALVNWSPK
jgi:hypothetical protein